MNPREGHKIPVQIHAALFGDLFFVVCLQAPMRGPTAFGHGNAQVHVAPRFPAGRAFGHAAVYKAGVGPTATGAATSTGSSTGNEYEY